MVDSVDSSSDVVAAARAAAAVKRADLPETLPEPKGSTTWAEQQTQQKPAPTELSEDARHALATRAQRIQTRSR
jgi:hypothetical protein